MSKKRRVFDKELKLMKVELSNNRTELGALAKELDISPAMLYRFSTKQNGSFPGNGKVVLSEQELARLKKELLEAQMERNTLRSCMS